MNNLRLRPSFFLLAIWLNATTGPAAIPNLSFSYVPQPSGNAVAVRPGETIGLPQVVAGSASTIQFAMVNRGTTPVTWSGTILQAGNEFRTESIPVLPAILSPNQEARFVIRFQPAAIGVSTGRLELSFGAERIEFVVTGSAIGPRYTYELLSGEDVQSVVPGATITLPDSNVGERTQVRLRLRNTGTAAGQISSLSAQGAGFQLADAPLLPAMLQPGEGFSFLIAFAPTQPGRSSGRLLVQQDGFELAALGIGPSLSYRYVLDDSAVSINSGGSLIFNPVAIGKTATARFLVSNAGTAAASLRVVGLSGSPGFALLNVPVLPATVDPGTSLGFDVTFAPTATGVQSTSLRIDSAGFTITAQATEAVPIPNYRFQAPDSIVQPRQQLGIGLTLEAPYPIDIQGTLSLAVASNEFAVDPSVQFATGGKTIAFSVPAGSTQARFAEGETQARFQTGTVAGRISFTPSFRTTSGTVLPPEALVVSSHDLLPSPPRPVTLSVASSGATGITLEITGFATNRQVDSMEFRFTPAAGSGLTPITARVDAAQSFAAWYRTTSSTAYGSQFTASVPFTLQGTVPGSPSLVQALDSVSVVLRNQLGESSPFAVSLR